NAWLQEFPDPMTKIVWDNAALISFEDAQKLGVRGDEKFEITIGSRKLSLPVWIVPGQAAGTIVLPLGYGRGATAGVCARNVGFDTYKLRATGTFYVAPKVTLTRAAGEHDLTGTQDHHSIQSRVGTREAEGSGHDAGRLHELFREDTLAAYSADKNFAN